MNFKGWLLALGLCMAGSQAFAACATTSLTFKDASASTQTLCFGGAVGQYIPQYSIIDNSGNIVGTTANALDINIKSGFPSSIIANAGTNLNTSALALEAGGNLATLAGGVTASVYQHNTKQVNGVTVLAGAGTVGTGAQRIAVGQDTTTIAGSAPGTAGVASTNVLSVQGIASMTKLLVTPDSVALPANQSVNVAQVNGVTTLTGTGATGTGAQRVTVATDAATVAGSSSLPAGGQIIGKVGIDQTTDITTNGVEIAPTTGSAASITSVVSTTGEVGHVLKASAGNMYSVYATNLGSTAGVLMVVDAASVPGDGAVTPLECAPIPSSGYVSIDYRPGPPKRFTTGISAFVSIGPDCFTKTTGASLHAFFSGDVK